MEEGEGDFFDGLPEGFLAEALALTSPRDACRLSSTNSVFRSAADWDSLWQSFLPPEYLPEVVVADGDGGHHSKKSLYLRICDHPLIIDQGNKSFSLDKGSGKKCYMLAARHLSISRADSPNCWRWTSIAESRFPEVIELITVCLLEVNGTINTSILSPNTTYAAYLVFKTTPKAYGFEYQPVEVSIGRHGDKCETRMAYLDPEAGLRRRLQPRRRIGLFSRGPFANYAVVPPSKEIGPKPRPDGWLEIKIGEYLNEQGDETELEMSVMEVKGGNWKSGLIIQGIEIRPKDFMQDRKKPTTEE
ncbi:putative F-box protein PP2-B12 [Cynara cardunculus var. scolymus]|uniref:F-box domain, cyclin-like protein n=1 Tax=Cynara cardunculus var. scolymus TaxID=59895 RepID=A0A103YEZ3_CYNCS|nr:putative F-box protein PP2-B12 [Cynara cardunculus var. scolymus]KVI07865.1 F-box domain, cyclin-like protein [Cynara cardunculus var. scolymus]